MDNFSIHSDNYIKNKFIESALNYHVSLSDDQVGQLFLYRDLVLEENEKMNLTAITDPFDFLIKHFLDSMAIGLSKVPVNDPIRVIDVGTGAGFPGLVLKIVFPAWNLVLFDSLLKRVHFLEYVIERLNLSGVTAIHGRAEDFGKNMSYRESFDLSVSRAVANISSLSEYCLPFVQVGGSFVAYKSGSYQDELSTGLFAIDSLGGKVDRVIDYDLDESIFTQKDVISSAGRSLIIIDKISPTPSKYPRKAGVPVKRPIKG